MHKAVDNDFKYLFIVLRPMIRGFEFWRPVVVVDGAHLSDLYEGTFVSTSTLNGAGIVRLIFFCVVLFFCFFIYYVLFYLIHY